MDNAKLAASKKALSFVQEGMSIGLGTGSTAEVFIELLGKRNAEKDLGLSCIATSLASERQAKRLGLNLCGFSEIDELDAAFDGADQVDPGFNLIKGLGGALVREKIVDYRAKRFFVLVGQGKMVGALSGVVPVEVIPLSQEAVRRELALLGAASVEARSERGRNFVTDNSNFILHAKFPEIPDPARLEAEINAIPGVVDNGLFTSQNSTIIVGKDRGPAEVLVR